MELLKYKYYDTPEGHNLSGKLLYTGKWAFATSLFYSTYDITLYTRPQGVGPVIGRYIFHSSHMVGMAATFTTTVFMLNKLRGKDDHLNYIIGGGMAGLLMGSWTKSKVNGIYFAMFGMIGGYLKKASIVDGWEFFGDPKYTVVGDAWTAKNDYTIQKDDYPRGYVTRVQDA